MESFSVPARSRLKVRCSLFKAQQPVSDKFVLIHHGICHTLEQYQPLIDQLNELGLHAVMVEQRSDDASFKNCIGLSQYRDNLATAVQTLEDRGHRIGSYVLHSMGAEIGEEMQHKYPDLQHPNVFLAPVPQRGAWPITWRIFTRRPGAYLKAVFTLNIRSLVDTPEKVRTLFFDKDTPQQIVDKTTPQLKHAPFRVYCELVLRPVLWWRWIVNDNHPKLLLISSSDEIFKEEQYPPTRRLYPQLEEHHVKGGHDFFLQYAQETAQLIQSFLTQHEVIPKPQEASPAKPSSVPEPHFPVQSQPAVREKAAESERA